MGDLNPYDVARRSNNRITPQGVSKIVKGESDLKVETLVILAEALGTTAPELLIKALSPASENATAEENKRLLNYYYDHIPEICQLYMVASARGVYQCQNTDARIFERAAARAATRETLKADYELRAAAATGRPLAPETVESAVPGRNPDLSPEALPRGNATLKPRSGRTAGGLLSDEDRDEGKRRGAA